KRSPPDDGLRKNQRHSPNGRDYSASSAGVAFARERERVGLGALASASVAGSAVVAATLGLGAGRGRATRALRTLPPVSFLTGAACSTWVLCRRDIRRDLRRAALLRWMTPLLAAISS